MLVTLVLLYISVCVWSHVCLHVVVVAVVVVVVVVVCVYSLSLSVVLIVCLEVAAWL